MIKNEKNIPWFQKFEWFWWILLCYGFYFFFITEIRNGTKIKFKLQISLYSKLAFNTLLHLHITKVNILNFHGTEKENWMVLVYCTWQNRTNVQYYNSVYIHLFPAEYRYYLSETAPVSISWKKMHIIMTCSYYSLIQAKILINNVKYINVPVHYKVQEL